MTNESIWEKVDLIEKRFENRLDKSNVKFNTLNPVWDSEKETALNVFEMIDELNRLNLDCSNLIDDNTEYVAEINQMHKENEQLKQNCKNYNWYKQYKTLLNENEELKKENLDLSEELDYHKTKCASLETGLFQADKEIKQLKQTNQRLNDELQECMGKLALKR